MHTTIDEYEKDIANVKSNFFMQISFSFFEKDRNLQTTALSENMYNV